MVVEFIKMKNFKLKLYLGVFFIFLGVVFLLIEHLFYQYVDKNGFLQESLFLPLSIFFLIFGVVFLTRIFFENN